LITAICERRKRWDLYHEELNTVEGIQFFNENPEVRRNYAYFPILVSEDYRMSRNELYDWLKENGIFSRKYFYPLTSDQACFKNKYKKINLESARKLSGEILTLPLYDMLPIEDARRIISYIR